VRTRVGYTGGKLVDPTYHQLGDHTEALQVDFDPHRTSYAELLALFWAAHRPQRPAYSRQYRAALWYADGEQEELARESAAEVERSLGKRVLTELEPLGRFYAAEDYHQKYSLRRHADLMAELQGYDDVALRDSTVAARLNGFVSGHGTAELLEEEAASYGLSTAGLRKLEGLKRGFGRLSV
jgi:peptide-methionine (S)-S-oxide reductase